MAISAMIATAVVGAGISYMGMRQQKKAAKRAQRAQTEGNKTQRAQAAIENRARRAKLIRQAQLARANAENIQATQGAGGATTTMATGALATANTQQAVNLSNFAEVGRQGALAGTASLELGRAKSQFQRGAGMMKLGGTIMSNAQRIGGMSGMFGTGGGGITPTPDTPGGNVP